VSSARYLSSQRYYIKKERELDDEMEAAEEETEQEEGKKAKKKPKKQKKKRKQKRTEKEQRKKKEKVMQELFPFRRIEDALIEMENGDVFLFLRIQANNLDLLSYQEVQNMIRSYSKDIDRDRFKVGYFITDSVFKIGNNIQAIEKAKEKQRIPFLRMLLDQEKYLLQMKKDDANKKMYCIRVLIKEKDRKNLDLDDV
ncbi:ATP-binding protein, partial [[Clostridium] innocuum]|nr:ATP-binding protein [[Clostridium] innocuum]MCR0308967.1 ATP-binding protein [[Clostridium] innocuum]